MHSILRPIVITTSLALALTTATVTQAAELTHDAGAKSTHAPGRWYRVFIHVTTDWTTHSKLVVDHPRPYYSEAKQRVWTQTSHSAWEAQSNTAVIVSRTRAGLAGFFASMYGYITQATSHQDGTDVFIGCAVPNGVLSSNFRWITTTDAKLARRAPFLGNMGTSGNGRFGFAGVTGGYNAEPRGTYSTRRDGPGCDPPHPHGAWTCPWRLTGCFNGGDTSQMPPRELRRLRIPIARREFGNTFDWARHFALITRPTTFEPRPGVHLTYSDKLKISYHVIFVACPHRGLDVHAC